MQGTRICFKEGCTASGDVETHVMNWHGILHIILLSGLAEIPSPLVRSVYMQNRNVTQLPTDQK